MIQLEYLGLAILDGLVNGFSIALIASGLTIVFGIINIVNLAHGELYMLGALVSWVLVSAGLGYGSALIVAPLVVSGMAVLLNML
ncbi:MAG: branched-chain amino acid ABC transporter permease, partial [Nitrososphaerota archaeon]